MSSETAAITIEMQATGPLQFLTFTIGTEEYGVDIMKVKEIKVWSDATRLPNSPEYMLGVINLRGIIVPIFDLRCRFHMGHTETGDKNVVIILSVLNRTVGILVDSVSDILSTQASEIRPAPKMEVIDDAFIRGLISLEGRMVALLDVDHLFDQALLSHTDQLGQKTNITEQRGV